MDCFSTVGRQAHSVTRTIKEVLLFESMTHPSTGTWGSTSSPTSGMRSYRTSQPSISGKPLPPPHNGPTSPIAHTFFILVSMVLPPWGGNSPLFWTSVCQSNIGTICGKYVLVNITFSHRPDDRHVS